MNKKENENEIFLFEPMTKERLDEMIDLINKGLIVAPVTFVIQDEDDMEIIDFMPSFMENSGRTYYNAWDIFGKYHRINESFVKDVIFNEPNSLHFDEFNRLVNQAKDHRERMRLFEETTFNTGSQFYS